MIGEKIREARHDKGITQKTLGELCGIAEPTIRRYELGKLNPKVETVKKIAAALGVTPFDLMGAEYFDIEFAPDVEQIRRFGAFEEYLKSLGFNITYKQEDANTAVYFLRKDGNTAAFTQAEFNEMQTGASDAIEVKFYKKVMSDGKK